MTPQPLNSEPAQGPVEGRGVAEIRALCDAATPGPWEATANHRILPPPPQLASHSLPRNLDPVAEASSAGNARFIAAARELVPQLLAEVEAAHRFEQSVAAEREALLAEVEMCRRIRDEMQDVAGAAVAAKASAYVDLDSLRGVVQAARAKLAEPDRWHRYDTHDIGEAFLADTVLDWRDDVLAALAAAADAPQPEPVWDYCPRCHRLPPTCRCNAPDLPAGPSPAVLPEKEQPDV